MVILVNFYGGPGSGKTTMALSVAGQLSMAGRNIEYVPDVTRQMHWQGKTLDDRQSDIFSKQTSLLAVALTAPKVEFVVTCAPLLGRLAYIRKFQPELSRGDLVSAHVNSTFQTQNYFVVHRHSYNLFGREQFSEEVALEIAQGTRLDMDNYGVEYDVISCNETNVKVIVDRLLKKEVFV